HGGGGGGEFDFSFIGGVEEGEELVILALGDGVVRVVVAAGAADGEAEPDGAGGFDAIENRLDAELLGIDAAFLVGQGLAMDGGGAFGVFGGVGMKVAGEPS